MELYDLIDTWAISRQGWHQKAGQRCSLSPPVNVIESYKPIIAEIWIVFTPRPPQQFILAPLCQLAWSSPLPGSLSPLDPNYGTGGRGRGGVMRDRSEASSCENNERIVNITWVVDTPRPGPAPPRPAVTCHYVSGAGWSGWSCRQVCWLGWPTFCFSELLNWAAQCSAGRSRGPHSDTEDVSWETLLNNADIQDFICCRPKDHLSTYLHEAAAWTQVSQHQNHSCCCLCHPPEMLGSEGEK